MHDAEFARDRRNCLRQVTGAALGAAALSALGRMSFAKSPCHGEPLRVGQHGFKYFDQLHYKHKPDLSNQGLTPIHVAYSWQIWGKRPFDGEIENRVPYDSIATYPRRRGLDINPPELVVLDIEHWPILRASPKERERNIALYKEALAAFRDALPAGTKLTYYNLGPSPSYFFKVIGKYREQDYAAWRLDNEIKSSLIDCLDFFCPSLYLLNDMTMEQWERRATDFIAEARRLAGDDRMVIPFIWPEYARANPEPMPSAAWRQMLESVRRQADSVVLWRRVPGKGTVWDENAEWWQETQRAIKG